MKENNPGCNCCVEPVPDTWQARLFFKDVDPTQRSFVVWLVDPQDSTKWGFSKQEINPFSVTCDVQHTYQGVTPLSGTEAFPNCDWNVAQFRQTPARASLTSLPADSVAGIRPLRFMNLTNCVNFPTTSQWEFDFEFLSVPGSDAICSQIEGTILRLIAGTASGLGQGVPGSGQQTFFTLIPRSRNCVAPLALPDQAVYTFSGVAGAGTRCSDWNRAFSIDLTHSWTEQSGQISTQFGYQSEFEIDGENRFLTVWLEWPDNLGRLNVYATYSDYRGADPTTISDQSWGLWQKILPTVDGTNLDCDDLPNLLTVTPTDFVQNGPAPISNEFDCDFSGATVSFTLT